MKRWLLPLLVLILLLTSCGFLKPKESSDPPEPEESLHLESLSVEVSRAGLSFEELAQVVRKLPDTLKAALEAQGVEVESVTVTVGSAPEATAQAVIQGGVDVAFLAWEDYDALEETPRLLLSSASVYGEKAMAAIVRPDDDTLSGETFAEALAAAVNSLREDEPIFGPCDYSYSLPN